MHRLLGVLVLIGSSRLGCSRAPAPDPPPPPPPPAPAPAAPRAAASGPVVEAVSLSLWYGKPPLKKHAFDITLRNPSSEPRWLVFPQSFPYEGETTPAPGGSEIELQSYLLSKHPRVVIARGVSGDFHAVRLPGHGYLTLRRIGIESWWNNVPAFASLVVLVAREVTIGGQPLASLIGVDPMCDSGADVDASFDASHPGALNFWHPYRGDATIGAALIRFDIESRAVIDVPLVRELRR